MLFRSLRFKERGSGSFDNTISDDISEGGIGFNASRFIAPSTPVMLEINILSKILHPIGKVCWCQPLPHSYRSRLGVEFMELDPQEREYLADYISLQGV